MIRAIGTSLVSAALLSVPGSAARVTYLTCDLPATETIPAQHYEYTLDEGNGTISWRGKNDRTPSKTEAVFTHDSVTWITSPLPPMDFVWTISRIDLGFTLKVNFGKTEDGPTESAKPTLEGKCVVADAPRKF